MDVGSGALLGEFGLEGLKAFPSQSLRFHGLRPVLRISFLLALASTWTSKLRFVPFFRGGVARLARDRRRVFCLLPKHHLRLRE